MSIIKKIYHSIINFIKMIITFIISLITSIFNIKKKDNKQNKLEIKKDDLKIDNINNDSSESPIELPDTNPTNINKEINPETDTSTIIEATLTLKKINTKKDNIKQDNIKKLPWTEEQLNLMFNKILEEEYDIEVKYTKYTLKDKIEELKIKLQPKIEDKIIYYEADRELKLHDVMKKVIMKELKEKPIKELEQYKKKTIIEKPTTLQDEIYIIATPSNKEINIKEDKPIIKEEPIISIPKEEINTIKEEINTKPFIVVPLIEDKPSINLKNEITNTIKVASSIIANETIDTIDTIIKPKKEIKEDKPDIEEEIKEQIDNKEEIDLKPILINVDLIKEIPDIEEIIEQKQEEIKEDIKEEKSVKKEDHIIKEEKKIIKEEPIKIVPILNLNPLINEENDIEDDLNYEIDKEEFEDKDYDSIEERINNLLNQLELFLIKNDKVLTTRQKNKIYNEQERLRNIKNTLNNNKEKDLNKEAISLEEEITKEEFKGLKEELQKEKIEHQMDLQNNLINKIEDLDKLTKDKADEIEKILIKQKLKRALRAIEIPAILSLPFIRNKYFRYFTAGLFITNHFNFLHGILRHQTTNITLPDINSIRLGRDALDNAINLNYENIEYLNYLEQEAIKKHPALANDNEYILYINNLRNKLNINYNRLLKKQQSIEKHLSRININSKKLKRKRYYQDIDGNKV